MSISDQTTPNSNALPAQEHPRQPFKYPAWEAALRALRDENLAGEATRIEKAEHPLKVAAVAMERAARAGAWDAFFAMAEAGGGKLWQSALGAAAALLGASDDPKADLDRWAGIFEGRRKDAIEGHIAGVKSPEALAAFREREEDVGRAFCGAWRAGRTERAKRLAQLGAPLSMGELKLKDAKGKIVPARLFKDSGLAPNASRAHEADYNALHELARSKQWADLARVAEAAPARSLRVAASDGLALALAADAAGQNDLDAEKAFSAILACGVSANEGFRINVARDLTLSAARRLKDAGAAIDEESVGAYALCALIRGAAQSGAESDRQRALASWLMSNGAVASIPVGSKGGPSAADLARLHGLNSANYPDTPVSREVRRLQDAPAAGKKKKKSVSTRPHWQMSEQENHERAAAARARQEAATPKANRPPAQRWTKSSVRWAPAVAALANAGFVSEAQHLERNPKGEVAASMALAQTAKALEKLPALDPRRPLAWNAFFSLAERGAGRGSPRTLAHAAYVLGGSTDAEASIERWSQIWTLWAAMAGEKQRSARVAERHEALSRALAGAVDQQGVNRVTEILDIGAPMHCHRLKKHNPLHEKECASPTPAERDMSVISRWAKAGRWAEINALGLTERRDAVRRSSDIIEAMALAANAAENGDAQAQQTFKALRRAGVPPGSALKGAAVHALSPKGVKLLIVAGATAEDATAALRSLAQISHADPARAHEVAQIAQLLIEQGADPSKPSPNAKGKPVTAVSLSNPKNGSTPTRELILNWKSSIKARREAAQLRTEIGLADPLAPEPLATLTLGSQKMEPVPEIAESQEPEGFSTAPRKTESRRL